MENPEHAKAMVRARAAFDLRRYEEAEKEARAASGLKPDDASAWALLASVLQVRARWLDSEEAILAGLQADPESAWLHRLRSRYWLHACRNAEALEAATEACRLAPESPHSHHERDEVLSAMGRKKEARDELERAVALAPGESFHLRALGDFFLESDPKAAEGIYREALKLDAEDAAALNNLGVALQRQKKRIDAAICFKAAVLLDPTLKVAKENTHSTISVLLTAGRWTFWLALAAGLVARWRGWVHGTREVVFITLGGTVALAMVHNLWRLWQLRRADPALRKLWTRIDADKRRGRI
jgi:tetratricopeptide (TPR) repeat protein